jgi:hypothetical protein
VIRNLLQIPHLTQLSQKFASRNVTFIGISSEEESTVRNFLNSMGNKVGYTMAIDNESANGASAQLMRKYRINGIPHAFIVGKNGEVAWHGHPMEPDFEKQLAQAAAAAPATATAAPAPSTSTFDPHGMTHDQLATHSVKELKSYLQSKHVSTENVLEKSELIDLVLRNID